MEMVAQSQNASSSSGSDEPQESNDPIVDLLQTKGHLKVKADAVLAERTIEVNQLLTMSIGSVLEFWKPCDAPAELMLGDDPVAAGEVVVSSDQHFCVRVTELAPPKKTYQKGSH